MLFLVLFLSYAIRPNEHKCAESNHSLDLFMNSNANNMINNHLGVNLWQPPSLNQAREFRLWSDSLDLSYYENIPCSTDLETGGLVRLIINNIENNIPSSFIRISDGEGNLLPPAFNMNIGADLSRYCLSRISYIHFGDHNIIPDNIKFFADMIKSAINASDITGLPLIGTIRRGFQLCDEEKDVRAISGNRCSYWLRSKINNTKTSSAWFSRDLLPHYQKMLKSRDRVGLISTYPELAKKIEKSFEIKQVDYHMVPVQAVFIRTQDRRNTHHYPEAMGRILEEINPSKGMPYLVAAGLLGKLYCSRIKEMGGIAIDVGSIAEIWMGIQARGIQADFIEKWKLK